MKTIVRGKLQPLCHGSPLILVHFYFRFLLFDAWNYHFFILLFHHVRENIVVIFIFLFFFFYFFCFYSLRDNFFNNLLTFFYLGKIVLILFSVIAYIEFCIFLFRLSILKCKIHVHECNWIIMRKILFIKLLHFWILW